MASQYYAVSKYTMYAYVYKVLHKKGTTKEKLQLLLQYKRKQDNDEDEDDDNSSASSSSYKKFPKTFFSSWNFGPIDTEDAELAPTPPPPPSCVTEQPHQQVVRKSMYFWKQERIRLVSAWWQK